MVRYLSLVVLLFCAAAIAQDGGGIEKLTLENYERVQAGMFKREVFEILGKKLAVQIDSQNDGSELWCWNKLKKPTVNVIFKNGKVATKTQFGLK